MSTTTSSTRLSHVLAALGALALLALLIAGCQPSPATNPGSLLRARGVLSCELHPKTDDPCTKCVKQRCCAPMSACYATGHLCTCTRDCVVAGNRKPCADECPPGPDHDLAVCLATECADACPPPLGPGDQT